MTKLTLTFAAMALLASSFTATGFVSYAQANGPGIGADRDLDLTLAERNRRDREIAKKRQLALKNKK